MGSPVPYETSDAFESFIADGERFVRERGICPSQTAVGMIADKWKLLVLIQLAHSRVLRFKELQRALGTVSQKVLTSTLRELESDDLVQRTVYAEVPPRVEYRPTDRTRALLPILRSLEEWAIATEPRKF